MRRKKNSQLPLDKNLPSQKQKEEVNRETGIDIIGAVPWGTHLCQFYETKEDLIDILVPYFKTGLLNNEFCMWITSEPLEADEAKRTLKKEVKNLDTYIKKGQIEIFDATDWYTKSGKFNADEVLAGWVKKEAEARKKGFDGLRLTGNTFWLEKKDWENFTTYEEVINHVIGNYKMIAICSYSLDKCNVSEIIDVVRNHQFALIKHEGTWHRIESSEIKKTMKEFKESEIRYRRLFESAKDGILLIDFSTGMIVDVNPFLINLLGYSKDEFLKKHLWEIGFLKDIVQSKDNFIELQKKKYIHYEDLPLLTREGKKIDVEFVSNVYEVDSRKTIQCNIRDITERKKIEIILQKKTEELEQFFTVALDLLCIADTNGNFIKVNKAWENTLGYRIEELEKKKFLDFVHPDDMQATLNAISELASQKPILNFINRYRCKEGTYRYIEWRSYPQGQLIYAAARDITERKQAEEQLRETSDYLEKLLDYANAPIIVWDKDFKIIRFNNAFEHLTGYPSKMMIGKKLDILFPQESKEESLQKIQRTLSGEHWESVEIPILRKDKAIRIVLWNSANIYHNKEKNLIATIAQGIDITERKNAENAVLQAKLEWERTFDCVPDLISILDKSHKIVRANKAMALRLGIPPEQCINLNCHMCVHGKTKPPKFCPHTLTLKDGEEHLAEVYEDKLGGYFLVSTTPIFDNTGTLLGAVHVARDITERKHAEEALKESEEKYRRIVENTTNVIMVTQPDGIISYLSPSCDEVLGYPSEELIGTNPIIFHPDDKQKIQHALTKALNGEKGSNFEYRILTKLGNIKWVSHSWSPVLINKKLQSIVSVIEDITQRKTIEENIKKLNENLIHRSIELAAANKELEAFSYSVSHDLRAPLRSIDGFSQALFEDYSNKIDEQGKDYIQRVRNATQRMGQLIDDMLRLSRLTRAELRYEKIDFTSLAQGILKKLQTAEPSRKINIKIQPGMIVKGDKKLLEILLDNLLGNAWKFTGKNMHSTIEFGGTKKDNFMVYYIRDNGAGFDMAYADKLFIPFQRLHSVNEFPGTGIGLAIVSRIIHRHAGRIWAESQLGKGATFYFTLQSKEVE